MVIIVMMMLVKLQERSDYAELVERMQKEIDQLRSQVKHQRLLLVADDSKLTATCAALTDKVCIKVSLLLTPYRCIIFLFGPGRRVPKSHSSCCCCCCQFSKKSPRLY